MSNSEKMPTPGQMGRIGFMIAGSVITTFESSNITSEVLKNFTQEDANKIASKIVRDYFKLTEEKWFEEKKKISLFWKKFFQVEVDWKNVTIPSVAVKTGRIEYCPAGITCDQVFAAYNKAYGNTGKAYDSIDKAIKSQQDRPKGSYVFAWNGAVEPDVEHLNKSYDDAMKEGLTFMVPIEGLIATFRYRFETGNMLDVKGVTRFAALDSDGNAMNMCRSGNGWFRMDWRDRGIRGSDFGPRVVSF